MKKSKAYSVESLGNLSPEAAFEALCTLPLPFIFPARAASNGRLYTYVSAAPSATVATDKNGGTTVSGGKETQTARDPFYAISEIIKEGRIDSPGPFPFSGGAAGYFAYDLKNVIDGPNRGTTPTHRREPGLDLPLCMVGIYDSIYVYDHTNREAWSVTLSDNNSTTPNNKTEEVRTALKATELAAKEQPGTTHSYPETNTRNRPYANSKEKTVVESNTTRTEHITAIERALEYISAGDIYQINLSHMLTLPFSSDKTPFGIFRKLTSRSPAPFASYFDAGEFQILSNSPERLLSVTGGMATVEPIKGTRPRGTTSEEDRVLINELKESVKEKAEHVMIVDLERNDLGRVSVPGGVKVTGFEHIVTLPGLHHMVSTVEARLRDGIDSLGALRAAYPGGSITGAPKVRAMEIIDELERAPRSVYTGGIGWVDFSGDLDIAMAIRTAVCKNNSLYLNVGGGIVADSDPEAEYEETILKALDFIEVTKEQAG